MKLKYSNFNSVEGISTVILEHQGKEYTGYSVLLPEDIPTMSRFTGCRYAEMKAQIKALKGELKEKRKACDECRKFVQAVSNYKNFDKESPTAKAMYRQLNRRIKEVNKLIETINKLDFDLKVRIRQQDKFNEKVERRNAETKND